MRSGGTFEATILDQSPGFASLHLSGDRAMDFSDEGGGHRFQRVPPTERRGRVQTSTVTVAVLPLNDSVIADVNPRDVEITTTRGSGPGGQHRNVTESCVLAKHRPTGISVRIDGRSQHQNRAVALGVLAARIAELRKSEANQGRNDSRRDQIGTGMRSEKIRTYRTKDNTVTDHRSGCRWRLSDWLRGEE